MRPLTGITVVSLEQAIAAPLCSRHLADLGARVIKVERPGGGDFARDYDRRVHGQSSHFVWVNRSKESLALDIKSKAGVKVLKRLLANADILIQNLAPGAADRRGLSYDDLKKEFPQIIVCDISGYGADGPYRDKKAYDLLIQSEAGFLSVTGVGEQPAKAAASIADIAAGMYAYSTILAALIHRERTGRGCRVEISMLECMAEWMSHPLYYAFEGAPPAPRSGAAHASIYPYGPFKTGDGRMVMLGVQNEREWQSFCETVLERADLASHAAFATNSLRSQNRAQLDAIIIDAFSRWEREEVVFKLDRAQIANASVNTLAEVWEHPQLRARGRWREVGTPGGRIPALLPPGLPAEFDPRMDPVPAVGEHNEQLMKELGLSILSEQAT